MMLEIKQLSAWYASSQVLRELSLGLDRGEVLCLLGRNGAGKTTALRAIMGLAQKCSGEIVLDGKTISSIPAHEIAAAGVAYVPQGRRLFSELSVRENLEIGLQAGNKTAGVREHMLELFPVLRERLDQQSGTLSGGEQQMLAMARALCIEPAVLLMDEPTEGLMPSMIKLIREVVIELRERGVAILIVEQRLDAVLPVADRIAFIENGRLRETVSVDHLRQNHDLIKKYLGVG
jgi:branched-chain amino acid transport system ATP-binding protein